MENPMVDMTGYESAGYIGKYYLYRKIEDNNGKWIAEDSDTGEVFPITYMQARGYEPIVRNPIEKLSHTLGKILLPK